MAERWRSYQWRRLFKGVTEDDYFATSAVTVDWDLEFARMEGERQKAQMDKARREADEKRGR